MISQNDDQYTSLSCSRLNEVMTEIGEINHECQILYFYRFMWAVILSVCTAWMIFNIYYRFSIYLSHPKSVDMMFTYQGQVSFPTVTICNQNNYK